MARYVAFLRGINLGNRRPKMAELRDVFTDMGFTDVWTFIASGNVVFDAEDDDPGRLTARIEGGLEQALGYEVTTFLRTPEEVHAVADYDPPELDGENDLDAWNIHAVFLREAAPASVRKALGALSTDEDRFSFEGRELYWCRKGGLSDSPVFKQGLDRHLDGATSTARKTTTLRRLLAKLDA